MDRNSRNPRFEMAKLIEIALLFCLVTVSPRCAFAHQSEAKGGQNSSPPAEDQQFKLIRLANGTFEGFYDTLKVYKAADGEIVFLILVRCKSSEDAAELLETRTHKALKIIKRESILDDSEKVTGQVANLEIASKTGNRPSTEIIMVKGNEVRDVQSASASDASSMAKISKF